MENIEALYLCAFDKEVHSSLIVPLTQLLHRAYAPLAAQGMRYLASHQSPEKTLNRLCDGKSYLAFHNAALIGTVTLYSERLSSSCEYYRQTGVYSFGQFAIDHKLQGKGFGSQMMNFIEEKAKQFGAKELALDTSENAENLIKMYKKRGYQIVGHTQWDITNYRSVVMSKVL